MRHGFLLGNEIRCGIIVARRVSGNREVLNKEGRPTWALCAKLPGWETPYQCVAVEQILGHARALEVIPIEILTVNAYQADPV